MYCLKIIFLIKKMFPIPSVLVYSIIYYILVYSPIYLYSRVYGKYVKIFYTIVLLYFGDNRHLKYKLNINIWNLYFIYFS